MFYDFFQNTQIFSVKKGFEPVSPNEAIVRFQNRNEIKAFFSKALKNSTNYKALKNILENFTPSYCSRSRKNKPTISESDRLQALFAEINNGNAVVVLKNDLLNPTHAQESRSNDEELSHVEKPDFKSILNQQTKHIKNVLSRILHAEYQILENVFSYNEKSTGTVPVTLDLTSVQEHSTGWKKWDDPLEIATLGAFKNVAAYSMATFFGISNSIKAAAVIGANTELISAEFCVSGKSIVTRKWYGSYAIRYNIKTLSLEIPWIKYDGSGPEERNLIELKRKDRLMFINKKIYRHPEQMIPPFQSMDEFIADYKKGLTLPEYDVHTPIILSK